MKRLSFMIYHLSFIIYLKMLFVPLFLLLTAHCSLLTVFAQDEQTIPAPPPLKVISKEEKKQLETEPDTKKRTKLAIDLMEVRLKSTENFYSRKQYREMFDELGAFNALVDKTLDFLIRDNDDRGKSLANFKRFEMTLRAFLPRLELIRRELPIDYEPYVRILMKDVREKRAKAVETFFGQTVVNDN